MEIASLFATLGLKPDKESWAQGDRLISGVKKALGALAAFKAVSWAKGAIKEAADLGGNCCADLEERVAELEATIAKASARLAELRK